MTEATVERFHVPAEVRLERIGEDAETVSEINEAIQVLAEFLHQCLIDDDCDLRKSAMSLGPIGSVAGT
jgi:hypothetical protein